MEVLKDRVGHSDGIRKIMRERLNARGDRVTLREEDVRYIVESWDHILDTLLEAQRHDRAARGLDF